MGLRKTFLEIVMSISTIPWDMLLIQGGETGPDTNSMATHKGLSYSSNTSSQ